MDFVFINKCSVEKFFRINILIFLIAVYSCAKKEPAVNIYDSDEYQNLSRKEILSGESIWAIACFKCHMYGTNGAVVLEEKTYWDSVASKGVEKLFDSVWNGKDGEKGLMPPKGLCNLCSEAEIRESVLYIFHLARKVQSAKKSKLPNNSNL